MGLISYAGALHARARFLDTTIGRCIAIITLPCSMLGLIIANPYIRLLVAALTAVQVGILLHWIVTAAMRRRR
jgi:hypothetical protein